MRKSLQNVFWRDAQDERRAHWYLLDADGGNVFVVNRYSGRKLKQSSTPGVIGYYIDLAPNSDISASVQWKVVPQGAQVRIESVATPGFYLYQRDGNFVEAENATGTRSLWNMLALSHGASVPMVRYDESEYRDANITLNTNPATNRLAFEADGYQSFKLKAINWTAKENAGGCVLRFSLPDGSNGGGTTANVTIRAKDAATGTLLRWKTITLDSKHAWLYQSEGAESDDPNHANAGPGRRVFDHVRFPFQINAGEIIRLDTSASDLTIDYLETEVVPPALAAPAGAIVVYPGGNIQAAIDGASDGDTVFLAAGVHEVPYRIRLRRAINFWGAGMWHTTLVFNDNEGTPLDQGGITGNLNSASKKLDVRNMYFQGLRTFRITGEYQALSSSFHGWGTSSVIDSIWWDHMLNTGIRNSNNLQVSNCRVYDGYAGGIISFQYNQNLIYDNNTVRHADDDGLGQWTPGGVDVINSNWHCRYNTIEFVSRASGIGLFDLKEAKVYGNLVKSCWDMGPLRATASFTSGTGWDPNTYNEIFDNLCIENRGDAEIYFSVKYDWLQGVLVYGNTFIGSNPTMGLVYARHHTYTGYDPLDFKITNVSVYDNTFEYVVSDQPVVAIDTGTFPDKNGSQVYGDLEVSDCVITHTGNQPALLVNAAPLVVTMSGIKRFDAIIYANTFADAAGTEAKNSVPYLNKISDFSTGSWQTATDGTGKLHATTTSFSANYRFRLNPTPLNNDLGLGAVRATIVMRAPATEWVGISFGENGAGQVLHADANATWLMVRPTWLSIRGGEGDGGSIHNYYGTHAAGDILTIEYIYYFDKTVDVYLNGQPVVVNLPINYINAATGQASDPVISWAGVTLRAQPTAANGGAYIDSMTIDVLP